MVCTKTHTHINSIPISRITIESAFDARTGIISNWCVNVEIVWNERMGTAEKPSKEKMHKN